MLTPKKLAINILILIEIFVLNNCDGQVANATLYTTVLKEFLDDSVLVSKYQINTENSKLRSLIVSMADYQRDSMPTTINGINIIYLRQGNECGYFKENNLSELILLISAPQIKENSEELFISISAYYLEIVNKDCIRKIFMGGSLGGSRNGSYDFIFDFKDKKWLLKK